MLVYVFYLLVAAVVGIALVNWRTALYLTILLDVARDPVRKLTEGNSVWITVSVGLIWVAIGGVVAVQERRSIVRLVRRHPQLHNALFLLCAALSLGAVVAITDSHSSMKMIAVGSASYLTLVLGILIGVAFPRNTTDVTRFLSCFCLVNAAFLLGTMCEYLHIDVPALGGIKMDWIRYHGDRTVKLISGFYRSPDVMGWHAAMVVMAAGLLGLRTRRSRLAYLGLLLWASVSVLLCGRRKMIAMPFVFAGSFWYFASQLRVRRASSERLYLPILLGILVAILFCAEELGMFADYSDYAATTVTQSVERTRHGVIDSVVGTVQQNGLFGRGLGSATQGSYYVATASPAATSGTGQEPGRAATWQEDGAGRLVMELGVPGAIGVAIALILVALRVRVSLQAVRPSPSLYQLQAGLVGIVLANLACFIISHQSFSGDPSSTCFATFFLGMCLNLPTLLPSRDSSGRGHNG